MANLVEGQWVNVASRTVDTGGGGSVTFWIDAKLTSQDKATNKSYIDTRLNTTVYGSVGGTGYGFWVTGSGGNYGSGTWWYSNTTVCTGSYNVEHNADGTKTTTISASASNNYLGFNISFSGDGVLPKIDRYPQITDASNFNDEENPTITYTKVLGFQGATVQAGITSQDKNTIYVPYRNIVVDDGTYTFNLTNQERQTLRSATPNSNTLPVQFRIKTTTTNNVTYYSDLEKTMTIVNANPTYTYTIEEQNANVISVLGTDDASTIIENASQVEIAITPTAYKSATISSVKLTHNNTPETKTSSPYVFTKNVKANSFAVTVIDSRTNYFENTITKTIIPYTPVKINSYSLKRQNQTSSNVILNLQATYKQATFGSTANVPVVKWKLDDGSYTTIPSSAYTIDTTNNTLTISNYTISNVLPYTSKGYFSLEVSDLLTSNVENDILVIKGIPTFDYGEHDLKVNGDLYVADTDGENAVNVLDEIDNAKIYANTYLTTEIVIGKWINDEPIYRKVYSVNSFPNAGNAWVATGINNIDEVIYCGGFETNGNERVFLSSAYNSSNFDCLVYDHVFSGHNNSIRIHTASDRSSYSGYVWIDYTKSS